MTPEQAAQKYHWVKYDSTTNTVELYMDNMMLSGSRLCEAKFYLEHLCHITPRYSKDKRKPWFLDWGEFLHYCNEIFYKSFKIEKRAIDPTLWLSICKAKWLEMKMDEYGLDTAFKSDRDKYEDLGGWEGAAGLLIQYYAFYMDLRVRVVDTEITFGHNKEVFIGQFEAHKWMDTTFNEFAFGNIIVKCYLTGRIDLLVDNGYKIGPIDHKSTHRFDGNEHLDFNPHDGITGYILAINEILKRYREQGLTNLPRSSGGWIYHISTCIPSTPRDKSKKQGPRFKTTPIDKTQIQLEDYKSRQLSSFKRVAELLFNDKTPEWNTLSCNNIFFRTCEYKKIHEQPSNEWDKIIQDHYDIGLNIWDTRNHGKDESNT